MSVTVRRITRFTEDPKLAELDRRLVAFERNVADAVDAILLEKDDRLVAKLTNKSKNTALFGELWVLDTAARVIDLILPRVEAKDAGKRIVVVRTSASFAAVVHALGTTVNSAATHSPGVGTTVTYRTNGEEWWT